MRDRWPPRRWARQGPADQRIRLSLPAPTMPVAGEPAGGGLERLGRRPGRVAQLLPGPADVEGHLGGRHPRRLQRHRRVPAQEPALDQLGDGGHGQGQRVGHLAVGAGSPVMAASSAEQLLQGQVLATEDVAPPVRPVLQRQHLPGGHVVDVGHVQHGVHVGRHAAVQEVEDELAGRRGGPVPRPDREGRQDQRGRQALGDGAQHLVLGHVLGALVRAVEMTDVGEGALVGRGGRPRRARARGCRRCSCTPAAPRPPRRRPRGRSSCPRR